MLIETLFLNMLFVSCTTGIIILCIKLSSKLIIKNYSARLKYYLWIILAIRLLIPIYSPLPQPPITLTIKDTVIADIGVTEKDTVTTDIGVTDKKFPDLETFDEKEVTDGFEAEPAGAQAGNHNIALSGILMIIWLGGATILLIWQLASYRIYKSQVLRWSYPIKKERIKKQINLLYQEMDIRKAVIFLVSKKIESPMLIGIFKPILLLPHEDYDDTETYYILKHELTHYKRRDIWYKLMLLLANALHWFNPCVWIMLREAATDLELVCDDIVAKNGDTATRKAYSETILASIRHQKMADTSLSTNFYGGAEIMKQRFENIFNAKKRKSGRGIAVIVLIISIVSGCLIGLNTGETSILAKAPTQTSKSYMPKSVIKNVNIEINDVNVIIRQTNKKKFTYNYDKRVSIVTIKQKDDTVNITVASAKKSTDTNFVTIYVPKKSYKMVTVTNKSGGADIYAWNTNLKVESIDGAMSIHIPSGYSKTIDFVSDDGACSLFPDKKFANYKLSLTIDEESLLTTSGPYKDWNYSKKYKITNGKKTAGIKGEIIDSVLSIQ